MTEVEQVRNEALRKITELALHSPGFVAQKVRQYKIMHLPASPTPEELVKAIAEGHTNKAFIRDLHNVAMQKFSNAEGFENAGGADPISAIAGAAGDVIKAITGAAQAKIEQKTAAINAKANTQQKMLDFITAKKQGFKKDVKEVEDSVSANKWYYIGGGITLLVFAVGIVLVIKNRKDTSDGQ